MEDFFRCRVLNSTCLDSASRMSAALHAVAATQSARQAKRTEPRAFAQLPTPGIFIHPYLRPPLSPLSVASFFVAASPITPLDDSPDYLVPCINACISSKVSLPSLLVSIALKIRS